MIELKDYVINSADLGEENPLPDIKNISYIHATYNTTDKINSDESKYFGKGMIKTILPYKIQDGYNRDRKPRTFKSIQLENEYLKAVFLPELGGRLWSLYDKVGKRELLYRNTVFQPANLALRNAWFSGGIEFNVSVKGHNFLTCSQLFSDVIDLDNGEQVLHMYEFERVREITYSIIAYLPKGSKYLYLKEVVENTSNNDKFVYWWSNIAVPETKGTRIVVPTDKSFLSSYTEGSYLIDKISVPKYNNLDLSYPCNSVRSQDYFYKIPDDSSKWIAAINEDGNGLVQFSTNNMKGRKLFVWGMGNGGRHWGEWLSEPGQAYIEIQAGIAHTQLEHLPMKANETLSWTECYGAVNCDKDIIHSDDWEKVQNEVRKNSLFGLDAQKLETYLSSIIPKIDFSKRRNLTLGSGWGYVENEIRRISGNNPLSEICDFSKESVTVEEQDWLNILNGKPFENIDVNDLPRSYMAKSFFEPYLEKQAEKNTENQWYSCYQLGVLKYVSGDIEESEKMFQKSLNIKENAWSYRNIAMIRYKEYKDFDSALANINRAIELKPDSRALMVNAAEIYINSKKFNEYISLYDTMCDELKKCGRLLLYKALAFIELDRLDEALTIVNEDFVMSDIQEGELSVSYCWMALYQKLIARETGITDKKALRELQCEKYPLPKSLDYRMHE